jgi:hypothetical protein
VRETIQNSLDNPSTTKAHEPVEVQFNEHVKESNAIPGMQNLQTVLQQCLKDARQRNANEESITGIKNAFEYSKRENIHVLEISDFNTSGMAGPATVGNPFHNFLFTEGDSTKCSAQAGSHGLGKFAPLTNSELRTMFVSTKWRDGEKVRTLFQGMTLLCSRNASDGHTYSNKGYWGAADFQPLEVIPTEFDWMTRESIGTSIFLIGWNTQPNWQAKLIGHVISNYFAALDSGELTVSTLDRRKSKPNQYVISKAQKFCQYFDNPKVISAMETDSQDTGSLLKNAKFYLRCLRKDSDVTVKETQITPAPGKCQVSLTLDEDAPKKIAFIRNNILITDQIPYFWKNQNNALLGFAGVFEIKNSEGKNLFRRMENPSHTKLHSSQLPTSEQEKGEKALKATGEKLKTLAREFAQIQTETIAGPADIMKAFFSDPAGDGHDFMENADIDPNGKFLVTVRPRKRAPAPMQAESDRYGETITDNEPGEDGGRRSTHGKGKTRNGNGDGGGKGGGTGGTGDNSVDNTKSPIRDTVAAKTKRVTNINGEHVHFVYAPREPTSVRIHLSEAGADFSEQIRIVDTNYGDLIDGYLEINFHDTTPKKFQISCARNISGGVKLIVAKC